MVKSIESEMVSVFQNVQTETARKVLQRCLKSIISADKSTQMGHDMFAEERVNLENEIASLNEAQIEL